METISNGSTEGGTSTVPNMPFLQSKPIKRDEEDIESADEGDSEEEEEERVNPRYKEWKLRRKEWTKGQNSVTPQESILPNLSEDKRVMAYEHLVLNNRKAKKPIPLADALVILKAGWIATGQWPAPTPTAPN